VFSDYPLEPLLLSAEMPQRRSRKTIALFAVPLATVLVMSLGALRIPAPSDGPLELTVSLSTRRITVRKDGEVMKEYDVAIGQDRHPTPTGLFNIQKIVWNPAWVPPDRAWARGKTAKGPGQPANPMKMVKIFFREPDFYIHGTGQVESLGEAASHGCLRMEPDEAAELALTIMDNSGLERSMDWVKGILHLGEQRVVRLTTPTPLLITP
jgi:lipoprotein-anchoring transpeptidase ErfK/SrfK